MLSNDPTKTLPRNAKGQYTHANSGSVHQGWKGGSINWNGYKLICINGKQVREHRYLWEQAYGPIPPGLILHHKNGDKLDNRLDNLELVTKEDHPRIHFAKHANPCSADGCKHPAKAHGLCTNHCKHLKKYGHVLTDAEIHQHRAESHRKK